MKRILLTGGSGLVGSYLIPLLADEANLHLLSRTPPESLRQELRGMIVYHAMDLGNEFSTASLPSELDAVIYLAQSNNFRDFPASAVEVFTVNVAAPVRLIDYARRAGARQFIFVSSGGVYGGGHHPLREDSSIPANGTRGFYAASKYAAETALSEYARVLDVVLLRPFFVYGKGQHRQMLIPRLIDQVRSGVPVTLQGEDGISINPIHATDAAQAVKAALAIKGSHTINIAGPEVLSLRGICEEIGRRVDREPTFLVKPEAKDLVADITRMAQALHVPVIHFAEGIRDLVLS